MCPRTIRSLQPMANSLNISGMVHSYLQNKKLSDVHEISDAGR